MNKIFRIIWNHAQQNWVVTSELASRQGKSNGLVDSSTQPTKSVKNFFLNLISLSVLMSLPLAANAYVAIGGTDEYGGIAQQNAGEATINNQRKPLTATASDNFGHSALNYNNPGNLSYTNPTQNDSTGRYSGNLIAATGIAIGAGANAIFDSRFNQSNQSGAGSSGIAIGDYSKASGPLSFALGAYSIGSEVGATAIGTASRASGFNSLALMRQSAATNDYAMAIGTVAWASGKGSLAMGQSSQAAGHRAIAIGSADVVGGTAGNGARVTNYDENTNTQALGDRSIAFGANARTAQSAEDSVALGTKANAQSRADVAMGSGAVANGTTTTNTQPINNANVQREVASAAVALGAGANATGRNAVAIGAGAEADTTGLSSSLATEKRADNVAIGAAAKAAYNAVASGFKSKATGTGSVAIGSGAKADAQNMIAIGINAGSGGNATNAHGIAIGNGAGKNVISGTENVAIGRNAGANVAGNTNYAIGVEAGNNVTGADNFAAIIRAGQNVKGNQNIALGYSAGQYIEGSSNIAIGKNAGQYTENEKLTSSNNIAIGTSSKANPGSNGNSATAIGTNSNALANAATALGVSAQALGVASVAIGQDALATAGTPVSSGSSVETGATTAVGRQSKATSGSASAFGSNANASGEGATALGVSSSASGKYAVASGVQSNASGIQSTAIGRAAQASANDTIAIGSNAQANSVNAVALGINAQALAANAISIGNGNVVTGQNSGAIGDPTTITGSGTYSIGNNNGTITSSGSGVFGNENNLSAAGDNNRVIGNNNTLQNSASGDMVMGARNIIQGATDSEIIGNSNNVQGKQVGVFGDSNTLTEKAGQSRVLGNKNYVNGGTALVLANNASVNKTSGADSNGSIAIGNNVTTEFNNSTAIGTDAKALNSASTAIGVSAEANSINALAIGSSSNAQAVQSVAVGKSAHAYSTDSLALGTSSAANGNSAIAIGKSATTAKLNSMAVGVQANANGDGSAAFGKQANATGDNTLAAGSSAKALTEGSTALGASANASGNASLAVGNTARAEGNNAMAVGQNSQAVGASSVAVGMESLAKTNNSTALGYQAKAEGNAALAMGYGAQATLAGSVALGEGSNTAAAAVKTSSATVNGITYSGFAGDKIGTSRVVSVGTTEEGKQRQIKNVAAGQVTATSTDAINGSQLYMVANTVGNVANSVKTVLGGNAAVNPATGNITMTDIGGTGQNTINDAIKAANSKVQAGTNIANVATSTDTTDGRTVYTVNANGTTVSKGSDLVKVTPGTKDANNVTDYAVDLSDGAKASLGKADTALQSWVAKIDDAEVKTITKDDNSLSFTAGDNITLSNEDGKIKIASNINANGSVENGNTGLVNGGTVYNAIEAAKTRYYSVNSSAQGAGTNYDNDGAKAAGALAAGVNTQAIGANDVAVGSGAVANSGDNTSDQTAVAVGYNAAATGLGAVAIGGAALAQVANMVSVGYSAGSGSTTENGVWIGTNAGNSASGVSNIGIGEFAGSGIGDTNPNSNYNLAMGIYAGGGLNGSNNLVLGTSSGSTLNGDDNVALGNAAGANLNGSNNIAIGRQAGTAVVVNNDPNNLEFASGDSDTREVNDSISLGNNAQALKDKAIAIGLNTQAKNENDVALGAGAISEAAVGTTDATVNKITYNGFTGTSPIATLSVGSAGNERTITNVAAGRVSNTSTDAINGSQLYAVANELSGRLTHYYSVNDNGKQGANYNNDGATGINALAAGVGAKAAGESVVSIGKSAGSADANANKSVYIGDSAGDRSTTNAVRPENVYIGHDAGKATAGGWNTAIGTQNAGAGITGDLNVALGHATLYKVTGDENTGLGAYAGQNSTGNYNTSVGSQAGRYIQGSNNTSVGYNAGANTVGSNNVALGNEAGQAVTMNDTVSIGNAAKANAQNGDVALGANAVTATVVGTDSADINGLVYGGFAGHDPKSTVSVGKKGAERTITNVAAGRISNTSTDAINGSQLYAVADTLGNVANSVVSNLGGNADVDEDGNITMTNIGGTGKDTVDDAIKATKTEVVAGNQVTVTTEVDNNDGHTKYTVNATKTTVAGNGDVVITGNGTADADGVIAYTADLSQDTKDNIQKGVDAKDTIDTLGVNFGGDTGKTFARKLGEQANVKGGATGDLTDGNIGVVSDGKDTLNVKLAKNIDLTDEGTLSIGDTLVTNDTVATDTVTANNVNVGGTTITDGKVDGLADRNAHDDTDYGILGNENRAATESAVKKVDDKINNAKFGLKAQDNNTVVKNLDETIDVVGADSNISTKVVGEQLQIELAKNLDLGKDGSVTAGDTTLNNGGVTIKDGPSITKDGGINAGNKPITNVASGGTTETNAANIGDVNRAGWNIQGNGTANGKVVNNNTVNFVNGTGTTATVTGNAGTYSVKYDVNKTTLTTDSNGTVSAGGNGDTFATATDVANAINNAQKTVEVVKGTNIVSVDKQTEGKKTTFTVNAKGTTVTQGDGLTVTSADAGDNVTNYTVALSDETKADIQKGVDAKNTVDTKGVGFAGDSGDAFTRKLGEQTNVKGGVTDEATLTDNNIGVVSDGKDTLTVKLAKDLKNLNSVSANTVSTGDTTMTTDGITINNGKAGKPVSLTKNGLDNGGNQITNVASGGDVDTNAANIGDLKKAVNNLTTDGFILTDDSKTEVKQDLGKSIQLKGEKGITVTANTADKQLKIALGNEITVGNPEDPSNPAAPKEAGTINVVGKDGKNGVSIKGDTGNEGKPGISIAGKDGADGVTLTTKTDGKPGVDGGAAKPRLEVNNEQVATLNDGLKFQGNNDKAAAIQKRLNETLTIKGLNAGNDVSAANMYVENNGSELIIKMAKALTDLTSATFTKPDGNTTVVNDNGVTITPKDSQKKPVSLTDAGLDNGGNQITNVASGGDVNTNAANIGDLKNATSNLVNKGFNIAADNGNADNVKLGETVKFTDPEGNIVTTVSDNEIQLGLNKDLTVGDDKEPGTITVKGENGKDGVSLNGKDGSIGLNGKDGANGTITVKQGKPALDGKDGTTKPRLDINGEDVATLNDGLKFTGDKGDTIIKKLNETLTIKGNVAADAEVTDKNLRVDSENGELVIKMAKALQDLTSVATGDTLMNNDGITIKNGAANKPVSLTKNGLDNGGNQITNVASGGDVDTNAANIGDLKNATSNLVNKGFNIAADNGTEDNVKLGETVKFTDPEGNIVTTVSDNQIQLGLNKDLTVGDDKEPGTITVKGENGKDGVSLNGKDGSIGLNGKDGTNGTITVKQGKPALDGKDGTTKPRLDINGEDVATLNDGLKFAGDKGDTIIKKLNETVTIKGNLDGTAAVTDKNLRVDSENGELVIKMAKVLQDLTSVATGDTLMDNDGVTIKNGTANKPVKLTKDGLDNGGNKITNVAAGTAPTDAVNVSQLEKAQKAATTKVVEGKNIKVTETANADGSKTYKVATADDLDVNSVKAGDTVLNKNGVKAGDTVLNKDGVKVGDNVALTKDGLKVGDVNISTNGINAGNKKVTGVADGDISATSKDAVNGSQLYNVQQAAKAAKTEVEAGDNIKVTSTTGGNGQTIYTVATKKDVSFDNVNVGGVSINKDTGINAGNNKVTGVAAGDVNANSTDAVNGSQLHETNQNVAKNAANIANNTAAINKGLNFTADDGKTLNRQLGDTVAVNGDENITTSVTSSGVKVALNKNLKVDSVTAGNTVVNNDGVTIGTGDKAVSLTQNGLNNGGNRITNVAPGKDPTDAVNVAQLSNVANHLDNKVNKVAGDMKRMDKKLRAGIAGAAALGMLPQPTRPGKSMVSVGGTTYRNESAVALGVSRVSDNEKWVIKVGASANTRNNYIVGGSVGYQW